jgi:rhodanese-related sulfurtransferase
MKNLNDIIKREDVVVVDVRNSWEYDEGHVKNAVNIPLNEIPGRLDEFKNKMVHLFSIAVAATGVALR